MRTHVLACLVTGLTLFLGASAIRAADPKPPADDWVDPDTGHRIVRLSRVPGNNYDFYFHQNCFTASGDQMAFTNTGTAKGRSLYLVDMKTFACRPAMDERFQGGTYFQVLAPKSRQAFYLDGTRVCATEIDTGKSRVVATIPQEWTYGRGFTVNADETLLAGCASVGERELVENGHFPDRGAMIEAVWAAKLPAVLYTINLATGEVRVILKGTDWYGHVQFSPTDPQLLMFCHEGPWKKVERIWMIRTDGSGQRNMFKPEKPGDAAGHEFWDPAGRMIWYDRPRPHDNALVATRVDTLEQLTLPLENPGDWHLHYNVSADGKFFAGDGSANRSGSTGNPTQWITLLIRTPGGKLHGERLANLAKHDYKLEPNVHVSPDGQWIVYQADIGDGRQVYAVSVQPAAAK